MTTDVNSPAGAWADTAVKRVLIVDDEPAHRKLFCRILDEQGYACAAAAAAEEARALLNSAPCDILLTDIMMPGESGLDLVTDIHQRYPDMAVVMATGVDDAGAYGRAAELGVYGYLIKPVSKNQLLATLESAWIRLCIERENRRQARVMAQLVDDRNRQVAALKTANRKIIAQQADLIKQERLAALLQLAGVTAHEINQPLMVILGCLDLVALDRGCPEKLSAHAVRIKTAAERIAAIVRRIKDLHSDKVVRYSEQISIIDLD